MGRVDLESGKVYNHKFGPDKCLGRVKSSGEIFSHARIGKDQYLGEVRDMQSLAEGGAVFRLFFYKQPSTPEDDPEAE